MDLHHPLLLVVTQHLLGIFMSVAPSQDGEVIELSCTLGSLRVTISGPADQAADLLHYITRRGSSAAGPATTSEGSFELVAPEASGPTSSTSATTSLPVVTAPVLETMDAIDLGPGCKAIRNWWVPPSLDWTGFIEAGKLVSGHERLLTGGFPLLTEPALKHQEPLVLGGSLPWFGSPYCVQLSLDPIGKPIRRWF